MKRLTLIITLLATVFLLPSCSGLRKTSYVDAASFRPTQVRLNMDMDDFTYLGSTTVSVDTRTYLGIFRVIDKVNGEEYNFRNVKKVNLYNLDAFKVAGPIQKAMYKVVEDYPQADYFVIGYGEKNVERLIMGRSTYEQLTIKAYKLK